METVRRSLPACGRGLERGCRFMITANFLDDMRVHLLFNRFGCDTQRVFDSERSAGAVRYDTDSVHAEQWHAAILLVVRFSLDVLKRVPRQISPRPAGLGLRQFALEPFEDRDRD